ncbi:MAG: MFS transporter [Candidatus Hermodarchaeota archaeon]
METEYKTQPFNPRWNLISLCLASFIIITGFSVIIPFFPIYANDILFEFNLLGVTIGIALQIGLITAASKLMQFFLAPAYGDLSDNIGRKPLILIGMSLYTLLMVGYGLATDFITLFTLRALQGIGSASVWPIGEALVVDTSENNRRGRNLGYYMLSMLAGVTLGPFLGYGFYFFYNSGLGLTVLASYRLTFVGVGIFGLIATLMVLLLVKDPKTKGKIPIGVLYWSSIKAMSNKTLQSPAILIETLLADDSYRNRSIYTLYAVALVNGVGLSLLLPIIALFLEDYYFLDPGNIALIIGIVGVLSLFGAPAGGYLSDKFGRKRTVWISGVVGGIFMIFLGFKMSLLALILLFSLRRFLFSVMQPSFRALQSSLTPEEVRGKEFGVVQAANNLGSVIGPILGGYLYDLFYGVSIDLGNGLLFIGAGVAFMISGLLAILAMGLLLLFVQYRSSKQVSHMDPVIKA